MADFFHKAKMGTLILYIDKYFFHFRFMTVNGRSEEGKQKETLYELHDCENPNKFCKICSDDHKEEQLECKMKCPKLNPVFPRLCFLTLAVGNPDNTLCYVCHEFGKICPLHDDIKDKDLNVNFVLTYREV